MGGSSVRDFVINLLRERGVVSKGELFSLARMYGFKPGEVLRVVRELERAGIVRAEVDGDSGSLVYRLVVDPAVSEEVSRCESLNGMLREIGRCSVCGVRVSLASLGGVVNGRIYCRNCISKVLHSLGISTSGGT